MTFSSFFLMKKKDNMHILFVILISFDDSLRTNFVMNKADIFISFGKLFNLQCLCED